MRDTIWEHSREQYFRGLPDDLTGGGSSFPHSVLAHFRVSPLPFMPLLYSIQLAKVKSRGTILKPRRRFDMPFHLKPGRGR